MDEMSTEMSDLMGTLSRLNDDLDLQANDLRRRIKNCEEKQCQLLNAVSKTLEDGSWWRQLLGIGPEKALQCCMAECEKYTYELRIVTSMKFNIATVILAINGARIDAVSTKALSAAIMLYASRCIDPSVNSEGREKQWLNVQMALDGIVARSEEYSSNMLQRIKDETDALRVNREITLDRKRKEAQIAVSEYRKMAEERVNQQMEETKKTKARANELVNRVRREEFETDELCRKAEYDRLGIFGKIGAFFGGK
ncbi:MAG: hypothetical protein LBI69_00220 [Puniceicoccales bacterium]|jgi:ElaB/YqjD/DUF883 family membrane-anchored ribosome-binding protein|nr:hypothetical protein [Puniceicoccales bacterium]